MQLQKKPNHYESQGPRKQEWPWVKLKYNKTQNKPTKQNQTPQTKHTPTTHRFPSPGARGTNRPREQRAEQRHRSLQELRKPRPQHLPARAPVTAPEPPAVTHLRDGAQQRSEDSSSSIPHVPPARVSKSNTH